MGLTKQSEVWRLAKLRLAKNKLLKSMISFTADVDAIDCTVGDRIYVQHDVPDQWGDGGRVVSATTTDIIVGRDLTYESGETYKLLIRHADDTISSKTVLGIYSDITAVNAGAKTLGVGGNYTSCYKAGDTITVADSTGNDGIYTLAIDSTFAGSTTTLTVEETLPDSTVDGGLWNNRRIVVTVAFASAPEAGDLWTFGAQEVKVYTILDLSRDVDQKARLTCIEYDSTIYDGDSGTPLITPEQGITAPESAPWSQQAVTWSEVAARYPALATLGPPPSDQPMYTDIVFSDDVPNGRVTWSAGTITYKGAGYSITAGNSGTAKYIYWDRNNSPTTFLSSNTQSDGVGPDRFIRCINDGGVAQVIGQGKLYWGEMLIVETLSALSAQLGDCYAGSLTGTYITGAQIRTATSGKRVQIDADGISLMHAGSTGLLGTSANGGSDIVLGAASSATITGITQAANAKISAASHGFSVGNEVRITGVLGMTEINYDTAGLVTITDADPDADGNAFEVDINSTGFGAYTSGGTATVGSGHILGTGVLATINHPDQTVPFKIESEQIYGDFHGYDRSGDPPGAAAVGDECTIDGTKFICTVGGTPGTWEPVVRYEDRGDPSAWDLSETSMTCDGAYHDWDISSIVGVREALVHIRAKLQDDAAGSYLYLRKKGNMNGHNIALMYTQVANAVIEADLWVCTDASGVLEYQCADLTYTAIRLLVRGWWPKSS